MAANPLSDIVSNQYERWMYPQPILDLPTWLASNWQWFDPSHSHRIFWPDRADRTDLDILIAGCGTNQAAVVAYTNPNAKIVAVDVSQPSLDHHRYLKDRYGLTNLELHRLPIEELQTLNRDFDLIISTGVLHHLADPQVGMDTLARCLRQDGVVAIMLYARFGRLGVEMMQSVFREMGLRQNDASVLMVRDALAGLPQDHPVKSYVALAPDLQFDAGLVDTFLHGRERSYTVDDCIDLVESAGLVFQDLFLKSPYYPQHSASGAFLSSVAAMPERKQWSVMERINFRNGCHFFTACRSDRPLESYKIDFSADRALDYVPFFRYRCRLEGNTLFRPNWSMALDHAQVAFMRLVDGHRTIKAIIEEAKQDATAPQQLRNTGPTIGKSLFQLLWQLDFIAFGLTNGG